MPKYCEYHANKLRKNSAKVADLATSSTKTVRQLIIQGLLIGRLYQIFEQLFRTYKQPKNGILYLLNINLATFSTIPTNTNK